MNTTGDTSPRLNTSMIAVFTWTTTTWVISVVLLAFDRRLTPIWHRMISLNLLVLSILNQGFIILPHILNGSPWPTEGWILGHRYCVFFTLFHRFLNQAQVIAIVVITVHGYIRARRKFHLHRNMQQTSSVAVVCLTSLPWFLSLPLTARISYYAPRIADLSGDPPMCRTALDTVDALTTLAVLDLVFIFFLPQVLCFATLFALISLTRNGLRQRDDGVGGGTFLDYHRVASLCIVIVLQVVLLAPHYLVFIIVLVNSDLFMGDIIGLWYTLEEVLRAFSCLLPLLWMLLQPELVYSGLRSLPCLCRRWACLRPPGVLAGNEVNGYGREFRDMSSVRADLHPGRSVYLQVALFEPLREPPE